MSAVTTPTGADEFLIGFDALAQAVRRARGAAPRDRDLLTFSQLALLTPLSAGRTARVTELAAQASISPSTATRILDALQRRGLVRRVRSRQDRRGVTVSLTPSGSELLDRQDAWVRGRQRAFYSRLDDPERAGVAELLIGLAGLVDELAAGPGDELAAGPGD